MIPQLGAPLGFLISASIFFVLTNFLSSDEFLTWGWRFPFFVGLSLHVVALFARLRLIDTPEYRYAVKTLELSGSPVLEVLRHHWLQVLLGAYLPLAAYALFQMVAIFPLAYVSLYEELPVPDLLVMQMVGAFIAVFTCILSGLLADRFGRRRFLMVIAVLIGLLSFGIVDLLDRAWIYVLIGFTLLGLSFGQSGGTLPHRFKPGYRFTGVSLTTDLGWLFGAAFAPIVALGLTAWLGLEFAGYYLLSGAVATLISLYVVQRMSRRA
jgi:MFS family permease